jgi:catechol 2,3-dioxygenase-like lactoylglutathione lyase family enzyme
MPGMHHIEIWVANLAAARREWGWLLGRVGFVLQQEWSTGESWGANGAYVTFTTSPNLSSPTHDRRRAGVNHLAFRGALPSDVDAIMVEASDHGWTPLYQERYPHAGGESHYAGWLESSDGFKAEIVAEQPSNHAASTR